MFNFKLPSYTKYENTGMLASIFDNSRKLIAWYLGKMIKQKSKFSYSNFKIFH
jgi:hypothetical protein